jgi:hypothetical protein
MCQKLDYENIFKKFLKYFVALKKAPFITYASKKYTKRTITSQVRNNFREKNF